MHPLHVVSGSTLYPLHCVSFPIVPVHSPSHLQFLTGHRMLSFTAASNISASASTVSFTDRTPALLSENLLNPSFCGGAGSVPFGLGGPRIIPQNTSSCTFSGPTLMLRSCNRSFIHLHFSLPLQVRSSPSILP